MCLHTSFLGGYNYAATNPWSPGIDPVLWILPPWRHLTGTGHTHGMERSLTGTGHEFSASSMSETWKRIFSWEYATVQEGFIRRTCLWQKQRRKSISVLLESSWRKHRIWAGKLGLSAGTGTVHARQEIQIPHNNFSTPPWNLNSISSFLKKDPGSREISETEPDPTWPHNGESSGSIHLWVVLCIHRCVSKNELSRVQACQISTQSPSNKKATCWPPPSNSVQIINSLMTGECLEKVESEGLLLFPIFLMAIWHTRHRKLGSILCRNLWCWTQHKSFSPSITWVITIERWSWPRMF